MGGEIEEADWVTIFRAKVIFDGEEISNVNETLTDIVFFKVRDVRLLRQYVALDGETEIRFRADNSRLEAPSVWRWEMYS